MSPYLIFNYLIIDVEVNAIITRAKKSLIINLCPLCGIVQ